MTNKEKFLALVAEQDNSLLNEIESRIQRKESLKRSKSVAIRILSRLDELKLSQKDLAEKLNIAPQQVNKWVKGGENFTFETIEKIENALGITLMYVNEVPKTNTILVKVSIRQDLNNVKLKRTESEPKIIPFTPAFPYITSKCNIG